MYLRTQTQCPNIYHHVFLLISTYLWPPNDPREKLKIARNIFWEYQEPSHSKNRARQSLCVSVI